MADKPKDTNTAALTRKITEQPTFDSASIGTESFKDHVPIEVRNSMPAVPNRNRDDNGKNQDES
jgi:hypothetical protein